MFSINNEDSLMPRDPNADGAYDARKNEVERAVAGIFAKLLGLDQVAANDNFLLLGGESLIGAKVVSRIRDLFDCQVSVRTILVGTVAQVSAEIIRKQEESGS